MKTANRLAVTAKFIPEALSVHGRQLRRYVCSVADRLTSTPEYSTKEERRNLLEQARQMLRSFDELIIAAKRVDALGSLNLEQLEAQAAAAREVIDTLENTAA